MTELEERNGKIRVNPFKSVSSAFQFYHPALRTPLKRGIASLGLKNKQPVKIGIT
jgi:hypothetical protein